MAGTVNVLFNRSTDAGSSKIHVVADELERYATLVLGGTYDSGGVEVKPTKLDLSHIRRLFVNAIGRDSVAVADYLVFVRQPASSGASAFLQLYTALGAELAGGTAIDVAIDFLVRGR